MAASGKTNLTTPIIILAVLLVAAWFAFGNNGGGSPEEQQAALSAGMLVDLDRDAISRLDISTPKGESYSLLRQDDRWFALRDGEQYPADEARTGTLLDALPDLASEAEMSEKAEQHATFELNDDQAYSLAVYGGGSDPSVSLLVGKSTPNLKGCYVRRSGERTIVALDRCRRQLSRTGMPAGQSELYA